MDRDAMLALPCVESPLREVVVLEAAALYRAARRVGLAVRSSSDCVIAACALRHDLEVLHRDRDFTALAQVSPLRERSA
jgi:predicted nucleic acid-binding protein